MDGIPDLPELAVLSIQSLVLHECHDDQRARPLIERLRASGVLRNPPIVTPLGDDSGRYVVLDGANRITALREMGLPHALVQVVQPDDPNLSLHTWNHVVWDLAPPSLLDGIGALSGLNLELTQPARGYEALLTDQALILVHVPEKGCFAARTSESSLARRVDLLNAVVDTYKDRAQFDRTSLRELEPLQPLYPDLSGLLIFPRLSVEQVRRLVREGHLLPAGITRFTISPRVLRVNFSLDELAADKALAKKNEDLRRWIRERMARKSVRYYAESTFLFDE